MKDKERKKGISMEMSERGISNVMVWILGFGAINVGLGVFNLNIITIISNGLNSLMVATFLEAVVGVSGLYLLGKRTKVLR